MKKENMLVLGLIALAFAGLYVYTSSTTAGLKNSVAGQDSNNAASPLATAKVSSSDLSGGIGWKDYTPGLAIAEKQNKNVFLYFGAQWCSFCRKLKQTTFKDKKILAYLKENFISIHVDTDKNPKLSTEWQVKGLPTMWFLEPDGSKIDRIPGYLDAGQLLQILRYIHTKSYETMEFGEFVKQG